MYFSSLLSPVCRSFRRTMHSSPRPYLQPVPDYSPALRRLHIPQTAGGNLLLYLSCTICAAICANRQASLALSKELCISANSSSNLASISPTPLLTFSNLTVQERQGLECLVCFCGSSPNRSTPSGSCTSCPGSPSDHGDFFASTQGFRA